MNEGRESSSKLKQKIQPIIIKSALPPVGIISSHPERTNRIKNFLENVQLHTQYWGTTVYTGTYDDRPMFVACVPIGSAGAGLSILEMFLNGAEYIIRYGSNDYHVDKFTDKDFQKITLVTEVDNLRGLMCDSGAPEELIGASIPASPALFNTIQKEAKRMGLTVSLAVCHNTDDYHGFNYPDCRLFKPYSSTIKKRKSLLESRYPGKQHSCDMETGALFWRAKQMDKHAATVLQTIVKHADGRAYDGKYGKIAKQMEEKFCKLIFTSLARVTLPKECEEDSRHKLTSKL